jgi:hypothetical protein
VKSSGGQDPSISFSPKFFFRSLSVRDFFTPFSLALLFIAIADVVNYYSDVLVTEQIGSYIKWTAFYLIIPVNHVVYRIEHKRSNNFIGRFIHDAIFVLFFFLLSDIKSYLFGSGFIDGPIHVSEVIAICLGFTISAALFELVIALLKRILMLFKWQVL